MAFTTNTRMLLQNTQRRSSVPNVFPASEQRLLLGYSGQPRAVSILVPQFIDVADLEGVPVEHVNAQDFPRSSRGHMDPHEHVFRGKRRCDNEEFHVNTIGVWDA